MTRPLRVLLAEDNSADAELILRALRRAGFDPMWERVDAETKYLARLHAGWDIILSDFEMPNFGGQRALELLRQSGLDIPFIIISGTIGEDLAVEVMKQGAADYLLKDRLGRLGPAIGHAMEGARLRRGHRRTEESLRQSEAEFRAMTEASPLGIFVADCEGLVTYTNATLRRMLDTGFQEIAGSGWTRSVHSGDRGELTARWREAVARRENLATDIRFLRRDGTTIHASLQTAIMRESGRVLGFMGVVEDITERRRAEERVREQASMLDHAREAIIVRDIRTGRITFWNKGAERLYGWTATEATGCDISELIFAEPGTLVGITGELIRTGESHGERRQVTKSGGQLIVSSHVTLVLDDRGHPKSALVINIDITEQKNLEARFLRAQRMESIGTLASGVAHDLNNILSPILMSVPVLRQEMTAEQRESIISTIEMSAERGAQIVKQVLTFGRGIEGEKCPLQIEPLFREMLKIMRGTFPKNITAVQDTAPGLWQIVGDATQLHQILLNLCVNARDAMPAGGRITLRASNLEMDEGCAKIYPRAKAGPHVKIEVSDTGAGISPEIAVRIFDPFFTTKPHGQGTGLGLSTVLGIVQSHAGRIDLTSEPGQGTTFTICLPATPEQAAETLSGEMPPPGQGETILVVDDEDPILRAVKIALEANGYQILLASNGTEALARFASNLSIAAVLTDLMMPLMDGGALIKALRKMQPLLPIIASTGLREKTRPADLPALNANVILNKPYSPKALLRAVHQALHPAANALGNSS